MGVEYNYYHKKTVDAILDKVVAPSSGQSGTQPINIGAIVNKGIELSLRTTPIRERNINLQLGGQFSTNDNTVTDLGIPGQYFVVAAGFAARHQIGYPAFSFFEKRVVSAAINPQTGDATHARC